jgi:pimeloyl-ACP methyl ester carboxylesterase
MPHLSRRTLLALALALCLGSAAAPADGASKVAKRAVTFEVRNVNRSVLPCPSDGASYAVRGTLVGPSDVIAPEASRKPDAVTLYLHGFSFGAFLWSFTAVPRYDYAAALARAGHVSVVIDRLGYGSSDHPPGTQTCLGADADVAHQVIEKLRSGDYVAEGGSPPRFEKAALAGHAAGALIAHLEAYSFNDAAALVTMAFTPQVRQASFEQFYAARVVCEAGGEPSGTGRAGAYAYFGQAADDFRALAFHDADPAVVEIATSLRTRDPCGGTATIIDALVKDLRSLASVNVPVLLVCGREDAAFPSFACPYLKRRYTGSRDVSLSFVAGAGHALPLERTAPAFRRKVASWLTAHGF